MVGKESRVGATRFCVDQCRWGCPCKKPTTPSDTLDGLGQPLLFCTSDHVHGQSIDKKADVSFCTRALQTYSLEINHSIAERIVVTLLRSHRDVSGRTDRRRGITAAKRISAWSTSHSLDRGAGVKFLNDLGCCCSWTIISQEQFAFYWHVGDGVVFGDGSRSAAVNKLVDAAANELQDEGFKVYRSTI